MKKEVPGGKSHLAAHNWRRKVPRGKGKGINPTENLAHIKGVIKIHRNFRDRGGTARRGLAKWLRNL